MNERMVRADGIELAAEAFGDPAHPPVLLIMGAMASMLWWPDEFCARLAGHGRYVIRYDNRDTGLSTKYPPASLATRSTIMVDDAIRVLDGYGAPGRARRRHVARRHDRSVRRPEISVARALA